ncbi:MAG: acetate kinase, partial [Prochlorococcus sp.]
MSGLTLVINLGSSSLKAALLDSNGDSIWRGKRNLAAGEELKTGLESWMAPALRPHRNSIARIGHRVVHGGERFMAPTRIDAEVEQALQHLIPLAPLHNPAALIGIHWTRQWALGLTPEPSQWACFDTAFHSTLPEAARTYALAEKLRQKGFRRFGFHG